jgi:hypothetical protein
MGIVVSFIAACAAFVGGIFNQPSVMQSIPPQAAMVQSIVAPAGGPLAPAIEEIAAVAQNLLPTIKIKLMRSSVVVAANASITASPAAAPKKIVASTTSSAPTSSIAVTAQSFLNATALTAVERRDGPYEVHLATDLGSAGTIAWDLSETSVGGGLIPSFPMSYSCDPMPIPAVTGSSDQNPTFTPRTSYTCTLSLTPQSGNDLRTQSKSFSFITPPGQLMVTAPSAIGTVLKNGENDGGFVFTNEDTEPITITQMTLDISYTGLSTVYGPLVFRVVNPVNGQPDGDYHLENLPAITGQQYTFGQSGMVIPASLTIPAGGQKLLPIQVLGVDTMSIQGVNPSMTVTLRGITTNRTDSNAVINGAQLAWSCVVSFVSYDPNATSGAVADGDACGVGGN